MSSIITLPSGSTFTLVPIPQYPGLNQLSVTMEDAVANVGSPFVPGINQTQAWPGADAWSLSFTLPKMNRWVASPWRGFMAELRGISNVFQIGDPYCATPLGQADGAPVCATSGVNNLASATSLVTSGWTPLVFGQLLSGDYLQVGYRLHVVCEDVNSDASGNATIAIWPSLRESPPNLTVINLINCVGLFKLKDNSRSWHNDFSRLAQISFTAMEAR
jgi:hypothetical protein